MDVDVQTVGVVGVLAAVLIVEMRLLRRELKIAIAAIIERSRIRDDRRRRAESSQQPLTFRRAPAQPAETPEVWPDDEDTDIHVLMEKERVRARRDTKNRRGERRPRPGSHHDR